MRTKKKVTGKGGWLIFSWKDRDQKMYVWLSTSLWRCPKYQTTFAVLQSLSCVRLCNPMDCSTPGFPILHHLPEFAQTHVHWVSDAIQPSHPLSSPSPASNLSQHQGLFQWVSSSHQVPKVLELQLQHQSFQRIFRIVFLYNWPVWSPRTPRDSQESSPAPQFKTISSLVLSLLYGSHSCT